VIATSVGGLRDTIVDGATGWTYGAGDVDGLANAIVDVLTHPDEARSRAARGNFMVRSGYERQQVFDRFATLMGALCQGSQQP
jgi:glycosyltransferase involved in cell wall biosynthesis